MQKDVRKYLDNYFLRITYCKNVGVVMASIIAFIISNGKSLNEYLIIFCSFFALGVDRDPFCLFDSAASFAVCPLL